MPKMNMKATVKSLRKKGYTPIPLVDKIPRFKGWNHMSWDEINKLGWAWRRATDVGIRTDAPLFIVDVDVKQGDGFQELADKFGIDYVPDYYTPSGGGHYLFRLPNDAPPLFCNRKIGDFIDTRSEGHTENGKPTRGQARVPWGEEINVPPIRLLEELPADIIDAVRWVERDALPSRDPTFFEKRVPIGGKDSATESYWEAVVSGDWAANGRNNGVVRLGFIAARLAACAEAHGRAHRIAATKSEYFADAEQNAQLAGLDEARKELEREFDNGWNEGLRVGPNCPPLRGI